MKNKIFLWGQSLIEKGAWFFAPISWAWGLVSFLKNLFYDFNWFPISSLPRAVVSVGNLVAGGTGKTPFIHLLAQTFSHRNVAILSRGYGKFADEAALLSRRLPQVKVYVGKDRIAMGKKAILDGADLILVDDGFQYRKLFRDFDVLLLDNEDPFGKGHYLPWGYLRDSPKRIKKADAVFLNGKNLILTVKKIVCFNGENIPSIHNWRVGLFSGIAKPAKFKKTILELGADVISEWILADHSLIDPKKLKDFIEKSKQLGAQALICTEKDFVRFLSIYANFDWGLPLIFLEMEMKIFNEQQVWENLIAKIDEKIDNHLLLCKMK